jgi:hypothetical protein
VSGLITDPKAALIGAVLRQADPVAALGVLGLLNPADLADAHLQLIAVYARQAAERGYAPDPVAVTGCSLADGAVAGTDAIRYLSLLLADRYENYATPASARWYAVVTLDDALRCRVAEPSVRPGQAADEESIGSLLDLVMSQAGAVRAVADRRRAAAGTTHARLRAVGS